MSLQARLLAGLAVLVFVAIASTGWLALQVARGGMEEVEEERAHAVAEAAAGALGAALGDGTGGLGDSERVRRTAAGLMNVGGIRDVTLVDAAGRPLVGEPGGDAGFAAVRAVGKTISRRSRSTVTVIAPVKREGLIAGALRLQIATGETVGDAVAGSTRLLVALTLVDGGLILLFGALFLRGVVRPLEALSRAAERVAAGDLEVPAIEAKAGGEVGALATAFNKMTEALRKQREHLSAQREQLLAQEKLATVGRLAAGVAHEVGNPLTAVLGYVELLLTDEKDPEVRDLLTRIQRETGRIHRIVHDLLDYARPVGDELESVALGEVAAAAIDLVRVQPRFRSVVVENALPPSLPPARASSSRLVQVLLNLLLNAADAMNGSGRVRLTGGVLQYNGGTEEASVILEVADDGPGVPEEDRARIFDPFFTTKEPGRGTGLGLAVSRSIVASFGGALELVAPDGEDGKKGARFRVTLPVA